MHPASGRSGERGVAILMALMMVAVVSVVGTTLMFTTQTETWSSANYRMAGQARYAAEAAVHKAANFILDDTQYAKPDDAQLSDYNLTTSPVRVAATDTSVVFSSDPDVAASHPGSATAAATAFAAFAKQENILQNHSQVSSFASARLLTMHRFTQPYSNIRKTIQTWEINAAGTVAGPRSARVEVSAIVGQYLIPLFRYAAFAVDPGCAALNFAGGAETDSYDSASYAAGSGMAFLDSGGNVGSNGNLTGLGNSTVVHGSLSTPRTGVGNCSTGNVTAETLTGGATVEGGLIEMSQQQVYPAPVPPATALTGNNSMSKNGAVCSFGSYSGATCVPGTSPDLGPVLTPTSIDTPVLLGNVTVTAGGTLTLGSGTYVMNSLKFTGNSVVKVATGATVTIYVEGTGETKPIDFTGGSMTNSSLDPQKLNIVYGGTGQIDLNGGTQASALVYAPRAGARFIGHADFYGSVIANRVLDTGGAEIHYDRNLQNARTTASSPMLSSFTWKSF